MNLMMTLLIINPFALIAPFLYLLKTGGRERVHWERVVEGGSENVQT